MQENPSETHPPCRTAIFPRLPTKYLLFLLVAVDMTVRFWHTHKTMALREEYRARHGTIDVPEAMYFDSSAMMVQVPVLLLFVALQVGLAFVLCRNRDRISRGRPALLWYLWLTAWPICLFGPMLVRRQ